MDWCRQITLLAIALVLTACATQRIVDVRSANQDGRVRFLVLHFTDENFERDRWISLTRPHVTIRSARTISSAAPENTTGVKAEQSCVSSTNRAVPGMQGRAASRATNC